METATRTLTNVDSAEQYLANSALALEFKSGKWTGLYPARFPELNLVRQPAEIPLEVRLRESFSAAETMNYGLPGVQSQKRNLSEGGIWPLDSRQCRFRRYRKFDRILSTLFSTPLFDFEIIYRLRDEIIEREAIITYKSDESAFLYELRLNSPLFGWQSSNPLELSIYDLRNNLGNLHRKLGCPVVFPGDRFPAGNHQYSAMDCDMSHEVSMLLCDVSRGLNLAVWGYSTENEAVSYSCHEDEHSISFDQSFFCFARLNRKFQAACRRQLIALSYGSRKDAIGNLVSLKKFYGWDAPQPDEFLRSAVIYQVHGFIADFGGFKGITEYLGTLAELGVNILYLPPLAPPEAYLNYAPDSVAPCYGSPDEFRQLAVKAHKLGIKVIVDMIAHHIFRQSPLVRRPGFLRYDECGAPLSYSIGSVLTETGAPEYQEYYISCCRKLVEEYDIDGFRFDVAGFQLPNWGGPEPLPYKYPGHGVLAQTDLLRRLKVELDRIKPLIYLEEGMGVNGFRYVTHGWIHFLKKLKFPELRAEIPLSSFLRQLKPILEESGLKNRPNVLTMYHAKIHDTVLMQNFGREMSPVDQAITALIFAADGVPLITQGMEWGCFDWLRRIIGLRRRLPALQKGKTDVSLIGTNLVQIIRQDQKSIVKYLINFSEQSCSRDTDITDTPYLLCASPGSNSERIQPFGSIVFANESIILPDTPGVPLVIPVSPKIEWRLIPDPSERKNPLCPGTADEGSFSGNYADEDAGNYGNDLENNDWHNPDFNDAAWNRPFVPRTRQPYSRNNCTTPYPYIEDVADDAWDLLWTRMSELRHGTARFRRCFSLEKQPDHAIMDFASPAFYDFDLAVANGGIDETLLSASNPVKVRLNDQPVENGAISSELFLIGKNCLTVEVERNHGTHGFGGWLQLIAGSNKTIIAADENWLCRPFTYRTPSPGMIKQTVLPGGIIQYRTNPPPGWNIQFRMTISASAWKAGNYSGQTKKHPVIHNAYSGAPLPIWSASGTRHNGALEITATNVRLDTQTSSGCAIYTDLGLVTIVTTSPEFTVHTFSDIPYFHSMQSNGS